MSDSSSKKIIFIIGGTGAQGMPVVRALLAKREDGRPSPWGAKILTRNPTHHRAKELEALGAELIQGSFMDFDLIREGIQGCYGAFVNLDGFTVGEMAETWAGVRIFEIAKHAKLRHYVWSSLDNVMRKGNYDPKYRCDHYTAKGTVADWMKAQPNEIDNPNGMIWTVFTNGPYMDMLNVLFAPIKTRPDGTVVFAAPIGTGHVPMIALDDLAFWVHHIFSDPKSTAGKDVEVASALVAWPDLVSTFSRVTGKKAEFLSMSLDEWFGMWLSGDEPIATALAGGTTNEENFRAFWSVFRDDIITRDMDWIKYVHPGTTTLEKWMKDYKYDGSRTLLLKNSEDRRSKWVPNMDVISAL